MTINKIEIIRNILIPVPFLLLLSACGPSEEEKQNTAIITCNVMKESRNMDAAIRIKEINSARDIIGAKPYLFGDDKIKESIKMGVCEALVLDNQYEEHLNIAKLDSEILESNIAHAEACISEQESFLDGIYLPDSLDNIKDISESAEAILPLIRIFKEDSDFQEVLWEKYSEGSPVSDEVMLSALKILKEDFDIAKDLLEKNYAELQAVLSRVEENNFKAVQDLNEKFSALYETLEKPNYEQVNLKPYTCNRAVTLDEYNKSKLFLEQELKKIPDEIIFFEEKVEKERIRKEEEAEKERIRKEEEAEKERIRKEIQSKIRMDKLNAKIANELKKIGTKYDPSKIPPEIKYFSIAQTTYGVAMLTINGTDKQTLSRGELLVINGKPSSYTLSKLLPSINALYFMDYVSGKDFVLLKP